MMCRSPEANLKHTLDELYDAVHGHSSDELTLLELPTGLRDAHLLLLLHEYEIQCYVFRPAPGMDHSPYADAHYFSWVFENEAVPARDRNGFCCPDVRFRLTQRGVLFAHGGRSIGGDFFDRLPTQRREAQQLGERDQSAFFGRKPDLHRYLVCAGLLLHLRDSLKKGNTQFDNCDGAAAEGVIGSSHEQISFVAQRGSREGDGAFEGFRTWCRRRHGYFLASLCDEIESKIVVATEGAIKTMPLSEELGAVTHASFLRQMKLLGNRSQSAQDRLDALQEGFLTLVVLETPTKPNSLTPAPKPYIKRSVAQPLIADHLRRKPHDTAQEVASAVGCSVGLVAESKAWKLNQRHLKESNKVGSDPWAVELDASTINDAGGSPLRQAHDHDESTRACDDAIDARQKELWAQIAEAEETHPDASAADLASAVGCDIAEVKNRRKWLDHFVAAQAESAREEDDGLRSNGKPRQKWVERRP